MIYHLFLVLAIFAIGDFLGVLTKARLSSVFVIMLLFLVGFMTGFLPPDIIEQAGLKDIAKWTTGFLVFHMGTMVNLQQLAKEWKTVLTSIISMILAVVAGFIVMPFIGRESAIVSIPILNGGIVATQIMTASALEKGFTMAAAMGALVYAIQKFAGTPFASYFGKKEAEKIVADFRANRLNPSINNTEDLEVKKITFYDKHKKYYGAFTNLGITALFVWISSIIGKATGVSLSIWSLLLGATVSSLGIVPSRIMDEAKATGLLNMAAFASIIPSLAQISVEDLGNLLVDNIVLFVAILAILFVAFYLLPLWKIIGSKNLALGVSVAQLLGFPATYLISNEIALAVAENDEEKEAILDAITPKYVVAGLATVTTLSILMAGVFEGLL